MVSNDTLLGPTWAVRGEAALPNLRLLESLDALKPAGSGRVDTQAKELRHEAERLREALAEAELRNTEIFRRARHTRTNHDDFLWGELQRFRTAGAGLQDEFPLNAPIEEVDLTSSDGVRRSDMLRIRSRAAASTPEHFAPSPLRTSNNMETGATLAWQSPGSFHQREGEAVIPSAQSAPQGTTNSSGVAYISSHSDSIRAVDPGDESGLMPPLRPESPAAEPLVMTTETPEAMDVTKPLNSAIAESVAGWGGSDLPRPDLVETELAAASSQSWETPDGRSSTPEVSSQSMPISRSPGGAMQGRVVETIRSASPVPALLRDTAMPPMATVIPTSAQPTVAGATTGVPLPGASSLAVATPPPSVSAPPGQRGTAERSAPRRLSSRIERPSPLQTRAPPQSKSSGAGVSAMWATPPKRAPSPKKGPSPNRASSTTRAASPKRAPSSKRAPTPAQASSSARVPSPAQAPSQKRPPSPKQSSSPSKAKRKIPTPDALRKAFIAVDRNWTGWLTKEMLVEGVEEPKVRNILTMAFGKPFLEQSGEDLQEDLEYVFGLLDEESTGEVSIPDFITRMQRLAAKVNPLEPESPCLAPSNKTRWTRFVKLWRRKLAHTGIKIPLFSLRRCARHVDAGGDATTLAIELSRQATLLEACDWWVLTPSELIEATTALWRVVPAVRVDSSAAGASSDGARLLQAASKLRAAVMDRLSELNAAELTVAAVVLLRAPVIAGSEVQAAVEQRGLARTLAARMDGLSLSHISEVGRTFDELGHCEAEFLEAAVQHLVEHCGHQDLVLCSPDDRATLAWLLARYLLDTASTSAKAPGGQCIRLISQQAMPISRAAAAISTAVAGFSAALADADFARLVWALGHLGDRPQNSFLAELGYQGVWRARRLSAKDLTRVVWGLAVMGHRPQGVQVFAEAAARAVSRAENSVRMEAPELAHLAAALGTWEVGDAELLRPVWEVLRRRVADFTGDELLMVLCSTVRLGIRDDVLVSTTQARALCVGPFDPAGVKDFMQCLVEYWCSWKSDQLRELAASYAVQATRHGGARVELMSCLGPAPSVRGAGPHARSDRLLNAQRAACVRG